MSYKLLLIPFVSVFMSFASFAEAGTAEAASRSKYVPPERFYQASRLYEGDRHGDFKDDYVAILDDGSQWKVHPLDSTLFATWNANDQVAIRTRSDFYWFKREHQFEMHNSTRNQAVRVMLVRYPENPLVFTKKTVYYTTGQLVFTLSDGSSWDVLSIYWRYKEGDPVYIGADLKSTFGIEYFKPFMISGTEREAVCAPASIIK